VTIALRRAARRFGDVRPGEWPTVLLLLSNVFVLLVAYYVLKTIREPLILASGGAELKSYAAAFQAALLVGFVPAFGWLSSRVDRARLVVSVVLFFVCCVEGFYLASLSSLPHLGFAFFVWVGIFGVASIALFWSYANDVHGPAAGERLFPLIAIGAAVGSPVGSGIAELLFERGVSPVRMLHLGAALLLVHLGLYQLIEWRVRSAGVQQARATGPLAKGPGGFALVWRSGYLRLVAALLVFLNLGNTIGEYVLGRSVVSAARLAAAADPTFDVAAYIGTFYGKYFFAVNVAAVLLQILAVSRVVKRLGLAGVLLTLPLVAFGAYGLVAAGAGLATIRWVKTAENAVDYSVMNTGKQMLWLATRRDEKYKAKQAVDTFFVRAGDVAAAGVVYAGTHWLDASVALFGAANLVVVVLSLATTRGLLKRHESLCASGERATARDPDRCREDGRRAQRFHRAGPRVPPVSRAGAPRASGVGEPRRLP
jgi:AAA family ATP:ADP antiporter